jgi:FAD-linked sulfhydryl oxidase
VVGPRDQAEFKKLLGNATWRLLHTMAARYPDEPTETEKKRTAQFIELLGYLYPCKQCAGHMRVMMAENPPKVSVFSVALIISIAKFPK